MTQNQDASGNVLEFAIALQTACAVGVPIKEDAVSEKARADFMREPVAMRQQLMQAAMQGVLHILTLEKSRLLLPENCAVIMQADSKGQQGDPRDIVLPLKKGELGISVKRNNDTLKNPRLQRKNPDFCRAWSLDGEVSAHYRATVESIFQKIDQARKQGLINWRDLDNIQTEIYAPLVTAFVVEFKNAVTGENCMKFIRYMSGSPDYYKLMVYDNRMIVQGFNLDKSLSCGSPRLPKELLSAAPLRDNTLTLTFDGGWVCTMRIHSARSKLEDSLKWDVRLIAHPSDLYSHHIVL